MTTPTKVMLVNPVTNKKEAVAISAALPSTIPSTAGVTISSAYSIVGLAPNGSGQSQAYLTNISLPTIATGATPFAAGLAATSVGAGLTFNIINTGQVFVPDALFDGAPTADLVGQTIYASSTPGLLSMSKPAGPLAWIVPIGRLDSYSGGVSTISVKCDDPVWTAPGTMTVGSGVPVNDVDAAGYLRAIQSVPVDPTGATDGQALVFATSGSVQKIVPGTVGGGGGAPYANALAITPVMLSGLQTVDGVSLTTGMIVLCVAQADPTQNGPWTVNTGPWTRPGWFVTGALAVKSWIAIQTGLAYAGTTWKCINNGPAVVGTANLFFAPAPNNIPWPVDAHTMYYWQCAEQSGGVLYDSGPNAAHVTLSGSAGTDYTRTTRLTPHQAQFHNLCPTNAIVAQFTLPVAVAAASDFTIDFVCQWDATQYADYGTVFDLGDGGGNVRLRVFANANNYFYVYVNSNTGVRCDSVSQAWFGGPVHHIGVAWTNGVGGTIYVDGVPISEHTPNTPFPALRYAAIAGPSQGSQLGDPCFRGTVSNIHISNVARPASYFAAQYQYALHG